MVKLFADEQIAPSYQTVRFLLQPRRPINWTARVRVFSFSGKAETLFLTALSIRHGEVYRDVAICVLTFHHHDSPGD
jgi:hypothetical protein